MLSVNSLMPKPNLLNTQTITLIIGIMVALIIAITAFLYNGQDVTPDQSASPIITDSQTSLILDSLKSGVKQVLVLWHYIK